MTDFKIGDQVIVAQNWDGDFVPFNKSRQDIDFLEATICEIKGNKAYLEFDDSDFNKNNKPSDPNDINWISFDLLILESEFEAKEQALEDEYKQIALQVKDKTDQAVKLIAEAGVIAANYGFTFDDLEDQVIDIITEMYKSGWRSSSMKCL